MNRFTCLMTTADGKLTRDMVYSGGFVWQPKYSDNSADMGIRIVVFNNKKEWVAYDPKYFKPML